MCGIAGWLGNPGAPVDTESILQALHHRGPDGRGEQLWPDAGLLHTRLRIIDLSEAGAQPMANEDGSIWVVFNGEIYNHAELQRDLEARGHVFRGRSDTEVLPHLYEEAGADMFRRLRGMFTVAVFDTRRRSVLLGRDRFGIKPLFYTTSERCLAFASELNALKRFPGVDLTPDRQAFSDYASLFYVPAPRTLFSGIRALEPGTLLEARFMRERVETTVERYHEWSIEPDHGLTLEEAVRHCDLLVDAAVARQLESDVPLGALLSGGIDSSLVSAAAQRNLEAGLRTFNVRQSDSGYDETPAARAVAEHIGSDHRTLEMGAGGGSWENVSALLRHTGQPFADSSLFAVDLISGTMREHVTVALSGDGGDEGFGGYDLYRRLEPLARVRRLPAAAVQAGSRAVRMLAHLGVSRATVAQRLEDVAGQDDVGIVQSLFSWIGEREHRQLVVDADALEPPRRLFEPRAAIGATSSLDALSGRAVEANLRLVLPNDFLFKVDTGSMRHGLEVRVPLLDEDLFAFGLSLPQTLRASRRSTKLVLRGVAERRLPTGIAALPKRGFAVPVDSWVDDVFRTQLRELVLDRASPLPTYLDRNRYATWVNAFCDRASVPGTTRDGLYQRVMMLLGAAIALEPRPV